MTLKVVIIGASGLLGKRFCTNLVTHQYLHVTPTETLSLSHVVLFDLHKWDGCSEVDNDERVVWHLGDLCDDVVVRKALAPEPGVTRVTVFHFAAVLSGNAEDNFDLGMRVNFYGTLNVIERVRELKTIFECPQILVYSSTDYVACYNEANCSKAVDEESFRLSPTSYGVQKACMELLICDYSRKEFIDGRVGRISAMIGRPGFSNSISTSYSQIFTQTLLGNAYNVPIDMNRPYPCSMLENNVAALLHLGGKILSSSLGHNRVVQLPARSFTLNDIWKATQRVAAAEGIVLGELTFNNSAETSVKTINVVPHVDCSRAIQLGLPSITDLDEIIKDYVKNYVKK